MPLNHVWSAKNHRVETSVFQGSRSGHFWWRRKLLNQALGDRLPIGAKIDSDFHAQDCVLSQYSDQVHDVFPLSLGEHTIAWRLSGSTSAAMALHPLTSSAEAPKIYGELPTAIGGSVIASASTTSGGTVLNSRLPRPLEVLEQVTPFSSEWLASQSHATRAFWLEVAQSDAGGPIHGAIRRVVHSQTVEASWETTDGFSLGSYVVSTGSAGLRIERMAEPTIFRTFQEANAGIILGDILELTLIAQQLSSNSEKWLADVFRSMYLGFKATPRVDLLTLKSATVCRVVAHVMEYQQFVGDLPSPSLYQAVLAKLPGFLQGDVERSGICLGG
ncbi:hypothetical protein EDF62_1631 [Leucobacter luti]|uniref:Uncharacterized protein n=2 Tax=Leucobacter luti TaxID=340320 RepID=A0A4R6RZR7_9MICO|nr:hypothetical protein EDF62_1631 [Leucobacter luti]